MNDIENLPQEMGFKNWMEIYDLCVKQYPGNDKKYIIIDKAIYVSPSLYGSNVHLQWTVPIELIMRKALEEKPRLPEFSMTDLNNLYHFSKMFDSTGLSAKIHTLMEIKHNEDNKS